MEDHPQNFEIPQSERTIGLVALYDGTQGDYFDSLCGPDQIPFGD